MDLLKNRITNEIIGLLEIMRDYYPNEVDIIITDLLNNKIDTLLEFINRNFSKDNYSPEIEDFVKKLVDNQLIDKSYLNIIKKPLDYSIIDLNYSYIYFQGFRPIKIKESLFNVLKGYKINMEDNTSLENQDLENTDYQEITYDDIMKANNTNFNNNQGNEISKVNDEIKSREIKESNIDVDLLRKKILETQLNYINDASSFIKNLENKGASEIYDVLIDLNDLRFIQHSLSKLSTDVLEKELSFIEDKYNNNNHSSIDLFIIEVIKKNLRRKML